MSTLREVRTTQIRRNHNVNAQSETRVQGNTSTQQTGNVSGRIDQYGQENLVASEHDLRTRTGAIAGSGPTRTAVPDLLGDWRTSTIDATAHELAKNELIPELRQVLQSAARSNGGTLSPEDQEAIADQFFDQNKKRINGLARIHHADITKTPKHIEATLSKVVVEGRPHIQRKRDPFTPIAQNDPTARAKEKVLWENPRLMVLVDLFAPCPKALVVPKKSMMFPIEADKALLTELAQVAAHVSDAFSTATGAPPAGIWINPPQHLMVRQLHVHVLPQGNDFSDTGEPLMRAAAADPKVRAAADALFKKVTSALEQTLGKPS